MTGFCCAKTERHLPRTRLPTWSEYGRLCDRRFPAEHGLPVRWLLVLSRSERGVGYAGAIPAAEWKAALLNSAEHASWQPLRLLPQETGPGRSGSAMRR